jgi:hypothetical protein
MGQAPQVEVLKKFDVSFKAQVGPQEMEKVLKVRREQRIKPKYDAKLNDIETKKHELETAQALRKETSGKIIDQKFKEMRNGFSVLTRYLGIKDKVLVVNKAVQDIPRKTARGIQPGLKLQMDIGWEDPRAKVANMKIFLRGSITTCKIISVPSTLKKMDLFIEHIRKEIEKLEEEAVAIKKQLMAVPKEVEEDMASLYEKMMLSTPEGRTMFGMTAQKALPGPKP